jgi:hypothetical protein
MNLPLEQFQWDYPESGFRWTDGTLMPVRPDPDSPPESERVLIQREANPERYRRYNPLAAHPTLFKTFAEMPPTEEAYEQFASSYGALGVGRFVQRSGPMTIAEPLSRWRVEHFHLRGVVSVLEALQAEDVERLRPWFTVKEDGVTFNREEPEGSAFSLVAKPTVRRDWLWDWARRAQTADETLLRFATGWAQEQINQALEGKRGEHETLTVARVLFNVEDERMILHVAPRSLLAALWLQCARVLTLNPTFKRCEYCGNWFETSPDAKRRQAKYCSDRCRVAKYRQAKTKA